MPDIAKCQGQDCPDRDSCYRYTAPDSDYQDYGMFDALLVPGVECEAWWPLRPAAELSGNTG